MTRQQFLQNVNPYCHCEALRPRQSISSESGRSLVEMLGTLAIMGILTIGGIAGFNYAMNKQRANATVNYVNQLAVLGTGQMLAGNKPKLLDYPKQTPSGYAADITTDDDKPNAFYIEISEVPAAVCDEIISRLDGWKMVNDIGFFGKIGACADAEQVKMWFEITANANKGDTDYHCTTNADCKNRFGNNFACNAKGTCELSCSTGQVKTSVGCCQSSKVFNGGCCDGNIKEEDGIKKCCLRGDDDICCAAGEFIHNNECWPCDAPDDSFTLQRPWRCDVCPNRLINGKWGCSTECTDPDTIQMYGYCHCPADRPIPLGALEKGNVVCMSCDDIRQGAYEATLQLDQYGSTSQTAHYCNRRNGGGYSNYCAPGTVGVSWNETVTRLVDGAWIQFKETKGYGSCYPCDEFKIADLKYKAQCESCGGKWQGANWYTGSCEP